MASARCSKCNSPLDGDFGMITCLQCGEINFLDESPGEAAQTPSPTQAPTNPSEGGISIPTGSAEAPAAGGWNQPFGAGDNIATPLDNPPPEKEPALVEPQLIATSEPELPPEPKAPPTPGESIQEIADFGNQPMANTASGALYYDVHISRIDTLELRKAILEILKDARFKWSVEEIERRIHNGKLTLHKLSPIKASVLVKKIRHLDVQVHWSQGNIYETPAH